MKITAAIKVGILLSIVTLWATMPGVASAEDMEGVWKQAGANGEISRQAFVKCLRFVQGWLQAADPASGLIPRNLKDSPYWNARDSAADNYPFMVLTTFFTDRGLFEGRMKEILETEQRLCNRLDRLPDDWLFEPQGFRVGEINLDELIFGASEYMKDGLIPVTELLGQTPWFYRMLGMLDDVWKHGAVQTEVGTLPSASHEVAGDLLQVCSRMYWMTGNEAYRQYAFQLGDYFLLYHLPTETDQLRLDDHGCEVINGLSEAYFIAAKTDPAKHAQWRVPMHKMLDRILEVAGDENGLFYNLVNPLTGEIKSKELTDNWGYDYNAFAVVAAIDQEPRYREAVEFVLSRLLNSKDYKWENGGSDGYADSLEGGLNLINRFPIPEAVQWADYVAQLLLAKPRDTGIVEGWHGDGNFARTALMYAFWKTQGAWLDPWRNDLRLGAVRTPDGAVCLSVESDWPWSGEVRFDVPRHAEYLHMPEDYPRLNQFPEWFVVENDQAYAVTLGDNPPLRLSGRDLRALPLRVEPGAPRRIIVRRMENATPAVVIPAESREVLEKWQQETRAALAASMNITDLLALSGLPLDPVQLAEDKGDGFRRIDVEINADEGRRMPVVVTLPDAPGKYPAVVCIHGHGGTRNTAYDPKDEKQYKNFGKELARRGYVTIAADIGRHEVFGQGRTLMGERLRDLMRCVDYLESLEQVDPARIGCAGLSLGGEMTLWLAAMDTRIAAASSCGFLTLMDQMEQNHCLCWKFPGLREQVDFPGLCALAAPRALQCQNGRKEPDNQFPPEIARIAFRQLQPAYAALEASDKATLHVHPGAHEIDFPAMAAFFSAHLGGKTK